MIQWSLYPFFTLITLILLTACSPFKHDDERAGMCNELNSRMIFSGSTNITRTAEIQRAEEPLIQQNYDKKCY